MVMVVGGGGDGGGCCDGSGGNDFGGMLKQNKICWVSILEIECVQHKDALFPLPCMP